MVTCYLDGKVYVRKSIEKRLALQTREVCSRFPSPFTLPIFKPQQQCSPVIERTILLLSLRSASPWAPHLLCAFQSPTHLSLVMTYAEGGTLWDVLESSPLDGKVAEKDLKWWAPQIVSAIGWCHGQGFAHRYVSFPLLSCFIHLSYPSLRINALLPGT